LISTIIIVPGIVFDISLIKKSDGFIKFQVCGENAYHYFENESGGHRWQRIPPTESNGRYHTSTITVAVFHNTNFAHNQITKNDIQWFACRGTGNGGQNRNKRDTAVTVVHKATGEWVRCEDERSQHQNLELAISRLNEKLKNTKYSEHRTEIDQSRKEQVGSGMRGDKIRTIRVRDNCVTNHMNNKRIQYTDYVKGYINKLHEI